MDDKTVSFEKDPIEGLQPLPASGDVKATGSKPPRWVIPLVIVLLCAVLAGGYGLFRLIRGTDAGSSEVRFNHDYIAVIDVNGEISDSLSTDLSGQVSGYDHTWTMDEIDRLIEDEHNKGIFMRVDSPGGSVYTSDEIYYKILEYQEKTERPVYAYMGSMAASGGYYISAPCNRIYANRNCWTGSIGVTTGTMYNITELLDKFGIKTETITSGPNKSMGSSTEEMTDEHRAILQSLIDEAYEQFVGIVAEGRGMEVSEVKKVADGRILTAKQALDAGLIDGIMNEEEALEKMKQDEQLEDCEAEYLQPVYETTMITYFENYLRRGSESELSDYMELLQLGRSGCVYTISYLAPISR
ncbi:MAG: signal peptide peptidase SppA [Mogibacterium sp.]|nr:signal peptide peptidase SppA [Mogibacterium sp.]